LQRLHKQLERLDVLILDELGYVPFSKTGAELLFDVVSRAYERTSLILTTNLASTHTDGPNYEKLGWQEVVWTTLFSTVYEHDLYNLYAKILRDVRVGQRTNGLCGTIAPNYFTTTNSPSGGMYDDAPDWGSAMFSAPWQIYQAYGDLKILADNYGAMTNYLAYMKSLETGAGVVTYNGLGDWMAPAGRIVSNQEGVVYVMDTRILRDAAKALGKAADANYYSNEFVRVQAAYNNTFFDAATARYLPVCQANLAMPLVFGVVPAGSEQAVANSLVHDVTQPVENTAENGQNRTVVPNHITAGDIGNTFVWQALGDYGQNELVQTMILQSTPPGYLAMINEGETSLAENWNVSNIRSHNHDMMVGIEQWFYRTVGAISSLQTGYAQIQLKPGMPAGLANATAAYNCVRGLSSSSWTRAANTIKWNVSVPVNTTAKVYVPTLGTMLTNVTVTESGTNIFQNGRWRPACWGWRLIMPRTATRRASSCSMWVRAIISLPGMCCPCPPVWRPRPPISR
jgi:alpha-L-rhamnosidase